MSMAKGFESTAGKRESLMEECRKASGTGAGPGVLKLRPSNSASFQAGSLGYSYLTNLAWGPSLMRTPTLRSLGDNNRFYILL